MGHALRYGPGAPGYAGAVNQRQMWLFAAGGFLVAAVASLVAGSVALGIAFAGVAVALAAVSASGAGRRRRE